MTDTIGKAQIEVGVDASGVDTGIEKAKRSVAGLAQSAKQSGQAAASGLAEMGKAGEQSATKLDAASRRFIASVERQSLALGKSKSEYLAALAAQKGLTDQVAPYVAKMREFELANGKANRSLSGLASSLPAVGSALAGLSFIAVAAGIARVGQNAINAADNFNDLTQSTGIAIKTLASYELASSQSGSNLDSVAKGIKALGKSMVENSGAFKAAGIVTTDASEAFEQVAELFAQMPDGIEKTTLATNLFGKAGADLIPMLNLGKEGLRQSAESSERYAAAMEALAPVADKFNDELALIGINLKATAAEITGSMLPALADYAEELRVTTEITGGFANSLMLFGTVNPGLQATTENISKLADEAERLKRSPIVFGSFEGRQEDIADVETKIRVLKEIQSRRALRGAAELGDTSDARDLRGRADEQVEAAKKWDTLRKSLKETGEQAKATKDAYGDLMSRLNGKESGLDSSFWKDLQTLNTEYQKHGDVERYRSEVALLVTQQKFHADSVAASAKAEKDFAEAVEKSRQSVADNINGLRERAAAAELELDTYGFTKSQIEDTIIARLEEQRAMAAGFDSQAELVANLEAEIDARKRIRDASRGIEGRDVAKKAAEDSARAWENFSRDIESSLTDALYRSFEAGDDFGQAFAKNLERTFKTMVLKAAVQYVVTGASNYASTFAAGVTNGAVGNSGAAAGQLGGTLVSEGGKWVANKAGSYLGFGAAGSAASVGGITNAGTSAGLTASSWQGSSMGLTSSASSSGLTASTGASTAGSATSGASSTSWLPIVGWIMAGMTVANSLSKQGYGVNGQYYEGINDASYGGAMHAPAVATGRILESLGLSGRAADVISGAPVEMHLMKDLFGGTMKVTDQGVKVHGNSETGLTWGQSYQTVKESGGLFGKSKTFERGWQFDAGTQKEVAGIFTSIIEGFIKPVEQAFQTDIRFAVDFKGAGQNLMAAIEAALVQGVASSSVGDLFRGITSATGLAEAMQGFASTMAALEKINQEASILDAARLTVDAGSANLMNSIGSYYDAFFTEQEKAQERIAEFTALWAAQGSLAAQTVPATKEAFRALVESLDLSTASGKQTFATLMQLAPAFDQISADREMLAPSANSYRSFQSDAPSMFLSGQAAQERAMQQMADAFTEAGLAIPETVAEYLSLVAAQNPDTAAGQSDLAVLRDWSNVFAKTVQQFERLNESLTEFRESLWMSAGSGLSNEDRYRLANSTFVDTAERASYGDLGALNDLQGVISEFLDASMMVSATALDAARDRARADAALASAIAFTAGMTAQSLPGFAVGTNYVPQDMVAQIHRGERIIPAADNALLMQGNADVIAELKALRTEVTNLRAEARATANNTYNTTQALRLAMPDGDALAVRIEA